GQVIDHIAYRLLGILEEIGTVRSSDEVASLVGNRELFTRRRNETQFGDVCPLLQAQSQGHRHRRFNACAIDLAVALRRMAVTTGEENTGHQDWKECF